LQEPNREYFKGRINEPETNSNRKNCSDFYGGINEFEKGLRAYNYLYIR